MRVALQPLGPVPKALLAALSRALEGYGLACEVERSIPPPTDAYDLDARRYRAEALLAAIPSGDADRRLAVTAEDMYAEGLNFVFGLASIGGSAAIVSYHRLWDPDERILSRRLAKESVHELGHTWGLSHCRSGSCVMRFSNSLAEADAKGDAFCDRCRASLPAGVRASGGAPEGF